MSKADDIIDLGKKLMENPGTGLKILGGIILVGGTIYGGKKAVDVIANHFKERQKRKTKKQELDNEANAKRSVLDKEAELKKKEHEQKLEEIRLRAELRSSSPTAASSTPEEPNEPTKPEEEPEINIPDARNRRREKREVRYIVPRLISEGEIATIFGHEKIGKSYLGAQIAKDATLGGYSTLFTQDSIQIPKCRVYYYSAENWKDDVADRLPDGFLDEHLNFQLLEVDGYKVDELLQLLRHQLNQDQGDRPILVIIDNLSAIVDSVYSGDIDTLMTELIKIIKDTKEQDKNLTIILFAHDKTDRDLASAASVGRKVSTIIRFSEDSKDKDKRHIEIVRSNLRQKASYALMFKVEQKLHLEHIEESEDDAHDIVEEGSDAPKAKRDKAWWEKEMPKIIKRVQAGEKQGDIAIEYDCTRGYLNTKINQYKKEHPGK